MQNDIRGKKRPLLPSTASAYVVTPEIASAAERYFTFWTAQRDALRKINKAPGALVGALSSVAPAEEAPAIAVMSDEEIRNIPPVKVTLTVSNLSTSPPNDPENVFVEIIGDATIYRVTDLCDDADVLSALKTFCEYQYNADETRATLFEQIRVFTCIFWDWYERYKLKFGQKTRSSLPSPIPSTEDLLGSTDPIGTGAKRYAMRIERIRKEKEKKKEPLSLLSTLLNFSNNRIRLNFSMKLPDESFGVQKAIVETGNSMEEKLRAYLVSMDSECAKLWDATDIAWVNAYHLGTLNKYGGLEASANDFLEKFGYTLKKGTYKKEQKEKIKERLHTISTIFVDGTVIRPDGEEIPFAGHLLEVDSLGIGEGYRFRIRPTMLYMDYLTASGKLEVGHYPSSLLRLNTTQGVEEAAFKLGLYFKDQFRFRESTKNWDQAFIVKTVLEESEIGIETNANLYTRKMEYFEDGMDLLESRGHFAWKWKIDYEDDSYVAFQEKRLICIPCDKVKDSAEIRSNARTAKLQASKRAKRRDSAKKKDDEPE
jgi:hypothetical protein